jgi:multiple sugar transport system permease protein
MAVAVQPAKRRKLTGLERREELAAYLFLAPWIIGFLVFLVAPIGMSLYAAFTNWVIINPPPRWIGLENFVTMFTGDRFFYFSLGVTFRYVLMVLPPTIVLGLSLALLLNQKLRGMNFFRTVFYVPAVVSGVAVSILWLQLLDPDLGAINATLHALGVQDPPNWLNSATWALPAVALMSLWGVGGSAILYLAGLQNIPSHLYEAAEIDGANRWQTFWRITLPLLSPTMFFMVITGLIGAFQVFTPAYILGGGTKFSASRHLKFYLLHLYIKAFQEGKMGYASALAWVLVLISAIAVIIIYRSTEQYVYYEETGKGEA